MDTEERKDKGMLFHHLKAELETCFWPKVRHGEKNAHFLMIEQCTVTSHCCREALTQAK